jgi:hypothetical protein
MQRTGTILEEGEQNQYLGRHVKWGDDLYRLLHYAAENVHLLLETELIEQYNIPVSILTGLCNRTPSHFAASGG